MEDVPIEIAKQFLPRMTPEEKRSTLRSLRAIIDAELFDCFR